MSEPAVLFVKPGSIRPSDKGRLHKAGVIVVEVENPDDVKFVRAQSCLGAQELPHGDILTAAAKAIQRAGGVATDYFGQELAKAILARSAAAALPLPGASQ